MDTWLHDTGLGGVRRTSANGKSNHLETQKPEGQSTMLKCYHRSQSLFEISQNQGCTQLNNSQSCFWVLIEQFNVMINRAICGWKVCVADLVLFCPESAFSPSFPSSDKGLCVSNTGPPSVLSWVSELYLDPQSTPPVTFGFAS